VIRVKICGITTVEDAKLAVDCGASAIGMVMWPQSPRFITPERARAIVETLPPFVMTVGVFVNQTAEILGIARAAGLDAVQLHGDEQPDSYRDLPMRAIKALGVSSAAAVAHAAAVPPGAAVLLDAHDPIRRGGTGQAIDWSIAEAIARTRPVILSGGLNSGNVVLAIQTVRPAAVDVSSGVESAPGRKDPEKLREFFGVIRESRAGIQDSFRHPSFDIRN
jgi:phosphoribosylanthranilate isomerase